MIYNEQSIQFDIDELLKMSIKLKEAKRQKRKLRMMMLGSYFNGGKPARNMIKRELKMVKAKETNLKLAYASTESRLY